jgi:hypothetical protein
MVNKVEDINLLQKDEKKWFSKGSINFRGKFFPLGILVILFLLSFSYRLDNLNNSRHVGEVQFRSALVARSLFFKISDSIPEWRKQANIHSMQNLKNKNLMVREPPITELLTATGYKILGHEDLRLPRMLTSIFWMIGGIVLYKIAKNWESSEGAIVAAGYYWLIPVGVIVSISFQSDSLMMLMFLISIYAILYYHKQQTLSSLLIATSVSGLAFFVRPLVLFAISGAFLGLSLYQYKSGQKQVLKKITAFFFISYIPILFYYGYEIFITENLRQQVGVSFLPQLLLTKDYWKGWMQTATNAIGLTPLLAAIIGIPLITLGAYRALLIGLGAGYILFCLLFTYHIRYAEYYHAQLIPIVALSFTPLVSVLWRHARGSANNRIWSLFYIAAIILLGYFNFREINRSIGSSAGIERKEVAEEIGNVVDHSSQTVYVASYYGWPLEYYAELTGTYWPRSVSDIDSALGVHQVVSVEDRLENLGFTPEYFIITDFSEFNRHHSDLKVFLSQNTELMAESEAYLIYKLNNDG